MNAKTVKSFVKETLARILGDTDIVIAERNYRQATAIVKGQIHALEYQKVKEEIALEKAQKDLLDAKFPGHEIDEDTYLNDIHEAHDNVESMQEALDETNKAIKFNQSLLTEFDEEVDAPAEE